jgi:hypothetical protein
MLIAEKIQSLVTHARNGTAREVVHLGVCTPYSGRNYDWDVTVAGLRERVQVRLMGGKWRVSIDGLHHGESRDLVHAAFNATRRAGLE